jgi:hypothetical protein
MKRGLLLLMVLSGCHAYIPVVSDFEVAPVRMLEWTDIEQQRHRATTRPLQDIEPTTQRLASGAEHE